jgi:hypothetical protein
VREQGILGGQVNIVESHAILCMKLT